MALDFPSLPAVGQKYPQPPITGVPVYSWDGEKWTTYGGLLTPSGPADALPLMDATPAAFGTSMEYAREDHVHPTDTSRAPLDSPVLTGNPQAPTPAAADADTSIATTAFVTSAVGTAVGTLPTSYVRYDTPQTLTSPQLIQARTNIYAAPFDAMAYSGMQINGSMEVSQELGSGGTAIASGQIKYVCDGFLAAITGGAMNATQTAITAFQGFQNAVLLACTTANALAGANDLQAIVHPIEGYRWARLSYGRADAQPVTIGFWVYASVSGTMAVVVRNGSVNRSYPVDVAITAAGTWQYKTVTIPGDVTGTWPSNNTLAAMITFCFGAGSGMKSAANVWAAANVFGTPATTNFLGTVGNQVFLTGVTVLPGNEAPSAARSPFIMRPYDQELMTCRRYWQTAGVGMDYLATAAGTTVVSPFTFAPVMRAVPTMTTFQELINGFSGASLAYQSTQPFKSALQATTTSAGRHYLYGYAIADARL